MENTYLSFTGSEPTNDVKGVSGSSPNSPMQWVKEGSDYLIESASTDPKDTNNSAPKYLPERLSRHVRELTDERMQGRGIGSVGIEKAAAYISEQFPARPV